jgi:hypothetical protein
MSFGAWLALGDLNHAQLREPMVDMTMAATMRVNGWEHEASA